MRVSGIYDQNLASIKQALSVAQLSTAMNQDATTVDSLLEGLEEQTKELQALAEPHKGTVIDVKV